jgi:chemotaxis signal transduction protein
MNQTEDKAMTTNSSDSVVTVRAGTRLFAISTNDAYAIHHLGTVVPVPGAPPGVIGLTAVDGRISAVIDFHLRLGASATAKAPTNAVTVQHDAALYTFPVDAVEDVGPSTRRQMGGRVIETLDLLRLIDGNKANRD